MAAAAAAATTTAGGSRQTSLRALGGSAALQGCARRSVRGKAEVSKCALEGDRPRPPHTPQRRRNRNRRPVESVFGTTTLQDQCPRFTSSHIHCASRMVSSSCRVRAGRSKVFGRTFRASRREDIAAWRPCNKHALETTSVEDVSMCDAHCVEARGNLPPPLERSIVIDSSHSAQCHRHRCPTCVQRRSLRGAARSVLHARTTRTYVCNCTGFPKQGWLGAGVIGQPRYASYERGRSQHAFRNPFVVWFLFRVDTIELLSWSKNLFISNILLY